MARSNRSSERFKYGICLNDECQECKNKTIQQVPMRKELVCSSCGKPLRECPPPTSSVPWKKYLAIGIPALAVIGFVVWFAWPDNKKEKEPEPKEEVLVKQINIDGGDIVLKEGESKQLTLSVSPEKNDEKIAWSSENDNVATVDNAGNVNAIKEGSAGIFVKADKSGISASIKVTITKKEQREKLEPTGYYLGYARYTGDMKNGKPDGNGVLEFTKDYTFKVGQKEYDIKAGERITGMFRNGKLNLGTWYQKDGNETVIKQ